MVGRLRRDAKLFALPTPPQGKRRGRPRRYGDRIHLNRRGSAPGGWTPITVTVYGKTVVKQIKTFLAMYEPAQGLIRVVLVLEGSDWLPLMCTDPDATVEEIVEAYGDRATIEQVFHDLKEVHGWGQPQLRNVWANIAAANLACWLYTLIELWAWDKPASALCDRSLRPWDQQPRRPSHADRKSALRRELLRAEYKATCTAPPKKRKWKRLWNCVLNLST